MPRCVNRTVWIDTATGRNFFQMTSNPRITPTEGSSIHQVVRLQCGTHPDTPMLFAPNFKPLTWAALGAQLDYAGQALRERGIGRNDRVAVVLPDGPEMAVAFLTVSTAATFAPLNPTYRAEDFEFYLADLQARALILSAGQESPARGVARKRGIPILELTAQPGAPAGQFRLKSENAHQSSVDLPVEWADSDDVALVLHTSGTTSRPKMVPLTHRNLCSSGLHIARTLGLTPADLGLCVMPLFHIHGLIGALLSSVMAGARVVCAPGFSALRFFAWLDEFEPSWYTAVPTMHQAILAQAASHASIIKSRPLRLIRSSSSALPPQVMRGLEAVFGAPVIESYGMTEASHQMASNPLPPRERKPGSVGQAAGPEVAIMDPKGGLLKLGETGEIVIQGSNVTKGYENNPTANATAFTNGWFRTGDQGYLDLDGYLFITGRLKELINRGGEKVAPREIDEALLNHPAVRQAVAFAVPHLTLGEDIAAAVVVQDGQSVSESELRRFVAHHLPPFKLPTRIVVLKDIPKGPTGKIQRIGMADRLSRELAVAYEPPSGTFEELVASIYEQVLGHDRIGRGNNFFAVGGDSIRAMHVMFRLRESLGIELPVSTLFENPTPAMLALVLESRVAELDVESLAEDLRKLPPEEVARLLDDSLSKPL